MTRTDSPPAARAAYAGLRAATFAARVAANGRSHLSHRHAPPPPKGPLRVLMIAMYPRHFTGTKYRLDIWAKRLRQRGHHVELMVTMPDRHAERLGNDWSVRARSEFHLRMLVSRLATVASASDFHVAVIHMNDLPFWDLGPPFIAEALHRLCGRLILDLDDLPAVSGRSDLGAKARELGRVVDGLIVGNPALPAHYPGQPWWWVPTCVEPSEWSVPDRAARQGPPLLGWVGTRGNLANLEPLAPALAEICRRYGTKVRIVCSEPATLPGVPQEFVRWTSTGEQTDLAPIDIGLAPLANGSLQRHKCGLKAIQYMASGLPVVASPVGVLSDIVDPGETGFLACTPRDWTLALERLITDRSLRISLGLEARRQVEQRWSFAVHEPSFDGAIRGLHAHGTANVGPN